MYFCLKYRTKLKPFTSNDQKTAEKENTEAAAGGSEAPKTKTMQDEKPAMEVLPERRQVNAQEWLPPFLGSV